MITTAPSVIYKLNMTDGSVMMIDNPTNYPDPADIESAEEPYVKASIFAPASYIGTIMELCQERRGTYKDTKYLDTDRVELHYELPLNEIVYDFFDALKSRTKGYASFDYEFAGYQQSKLVKLDIMISGEVVDALSFIVHADRAYARARKMAEKLKENIPRQMFEVPIQAAIGGKIIARETVKAFRKDVLAKCYGGDITRKKKLLEKQKEGKRGCASSARWRFRRKPSWQCSSSTNNIFPFHTKQAGDMLSCLFYVLFVFLADCGLQNLLALHDADVDDKACNLVECDAQPDKEYVPFQNIGHQQSQRDADQPDAYKGNDHRGVFIAGGKQRFAQDARQVLRDLDEAHDEHIDNPNLLNIGVVGHHRHKDTRHQNQ